ncbi:MAG: hypothetical protein LBI49_04475 [Nocardiopsaceae bacterium]|jgi:hypothetical protein|nr:hypothetical protein [Nocardiopsaceae bacterium]
MPHRIARLAAVLTAAFTIAGLTSAAAASAGTASPRTDSPRTASRGTRAPTAGTLINRPAAQVCHGQRFTVGAWAQPGASWANRPYVVNVYNQDWVQVLHKSGHAPTSSWLYLRPTASNLGKYHVSYQIWHNGVRYRSKFVTRSVRC